MPIDIELLATVTGGAKGSHGPKPPSDAVTGGAPATQQALSNVDVFHMNVQKGKHAVPTTPLG